MRGEGRAEPGARIVSGLALLVYAAAALAPLVAVLARSPAGPAALRDIVEPRNLRALGFTLRQAAASTAAALAIGLPGAALVARYRFPGRRALKALSALPFSFPPVLMVLAFVLFYGRAGHLNRFLMAVLGLREPPIDFLYGFWGIVLVHGFYEFPVVLHTVGGVWEGLPREPYQAARLLGAGRLRAFATGVLPSLAPSIAQAAALCFLLCYFSFAVVMVFGGLAGSTIEVEVYRRARLEIDPGGAASLALLETSVALLIVVAVSFLERRSSSRARLAGTPRSLERPQGAAVVAVAAYAAFVAVFLGGPVVSIAAQAFALRSGPLGPLRFGLGNFARIFSAGSGFPAALVGTLAAAVPASALAVLLGCAGAFALRRAGPVAKALATLPLAVSGIVVALGWSAILPGGGPALLPLALAVGALPYAIRSIGAALATLEPGPAEAARTLGASPIRAAVEVDLGSILPSVFAAWAFAFAAAAGDVNVPLALGAGDYPTLPLYLYRLVSAHRFPEACAAGLVLAALTALAFAVKEGRSDRA